MNSLRRSVGPRLIREATANPNRRVGRDPSKLPRGRRRRPLRRW